MKDDSALMTLPELISIKKKIGTVAGHYQPNDNSSFRDMFISEYLSPTEFRELLRRQFGITMSDRELGAAVCLFDRDGDGNVSCREFLSQFFKLGAQDRSKKSLWHREIQAKIIDSEQIRIQAGVERRTKLTKICLPESCSSKDKQSGCDKIAVAAFNYRKDSAFPTELAGFWNGGVMDPTAFVDQMRRNFGIHLSVGEARGLLEELDNNGDGTIDCNEFLFHFFRLGRKMRDDQAKRVTQTKIRLDSEEKERNEKMIDVLMKRKELLLPETYSEDEKASALAKIAHVAEVYDRLRYVRLQGFDSEALMPQEFCEQVRRCLRIRLTPAEVKAAIDVFDRDGNGVVDNAEFISTFFRLGKVKKSEFIAKSRQIVTDRKSKEVLRKEMRNKLFCDRLITRCTMPAGYEVVVDTEESSKSSSSTRRSRNRKKKKMGLGKTSYKSSSWLTSSQMLGEYPNISMDAVKFMRELDRMQFDIDRMEINFEGDDASSTCSSEDIEN